MAETTKPPSRPRPTTQLSGLQVMFAVILAVGLLLAINFSSRIAAGKPLLDAYDEVNAEILELELEQATLSAELQYVQSSAFVERWARDNGKMIRPGERLVIPVPVEIAATPVPSSLENEQQFDSGIPTSEPWEMWWALFFDFEPPQFG
jgi:cell division protein FtsB